MVLTLDGAAYSEHDVFARGSVASSVLLTRFEVGVDAVFDAEQIRTPDSSWAHLVLYYVLRVDDNLVRFSRIFQCIGNCLIQGHGLSFRPSSSKGCVADGSACDGLVPFVIGLFFGWEDYSYSVVQRARGAIQPHRPHRLFLRDTAANSLKQLAIKWRSLR